MAADWFFMFCSTPSYVFFVAAFRSNILPHSSGGRVLFHVEAAAIGNICNLSIPGVLKVALPRLRSHFRETALPGVLKVALPRLYSHFREIALPGVLKVALPRLYSHFRETALPSVLKVALASSAHISEK